jgi:S1-C subfamily serine protease
VGWLTACPGAWESDNAVMETRDVSIAGEPAGAGAHPTSRWRSPFAIAIGAVLVAGIVGAVGFAVERTTSSSPGGVNAGVVSVTSTLVRGGTTVGAGMIITPSGEVLTTYHAINGAQSIQVRLPASGASFPAFVNGIDPTDDIAVLRVPDASSLPSVSIGDSAHVAVGDHVTAVGVAPGTGSGLVEAQGAVVALGQTITVSDSRGSNVRTQVGMIQTDAAINPSDDGGPLVSSDGHVIGVDAGAGRLGAAQSGTVPAYAIPINTATAIVRDIESGAPNPKVFRGEGAFLGVDVQNHTSPPGAEVNSVEPGSPARAAGITAHDVIVALDHTPIDSVTALQLAVAAHRPGDRVTIAWLDPLGQRHSATLQLVNGFAA